MPRRSAEFIARSERSKAAWEARWERGESIGKKGEQYLKDKYEVEDWTEAPIFDDEWEIDY